MEDVKVISVDQVGSELVEAIRASIAYQENTKNRVIAECEINYSGLNNDVYVRSNCNGWAEDVFVLFSYAPELVSFNSSEFIGLTEHDALELRDIRIKRKPLNDYLDRIEAGAAKDGKFWYVNATLDFGVARVREMLADCKSSDWFDIYKCIKANYTDAERRYMKAHDHSNYMAGCKYADWYTIKSYSKDKIVCEHVYDEVVEEAKPFVFYDNTGMIYMSNLLGTSEKTERRIEEVIFETVPNIVDGLTIETRDISEEEALNALKGCIKLN